MNKYISEFIGTAILFGAVIGSGIMGSILSPDDSGLILLYNSLVTSFVLYFLIASFQEYSSHFNPVVSLAFLLDKKISTNTFFVYVIIQILGAITGVLIANYLFGIENVVFSEKDRSGSNLFISEIIATFGLVLFILISKKENIAFIVASYIGAAYWFTSSTSFANPAGTIGRTFSDTFAGISPESILFFCIAQVIGSLMAFILYKNFYKKQ